MKTQTLIPASVIILFVIYSCSKSSPSGGVIPPPVSTAPTISSVSPDSGAFNATVTVTGTNFSSTASDDMVTFNGVAAVVNSATTTQLSVTVPKGAGSGAVKVAVGSKSVTGPVFNYIYTYIVSTLAGSSQGFTDGKGTAAKFYRPFSVAVDSGGNVIVADDFNNSIRKITPDSVVTTIAGNGTSGFKDGTGTSALFSYPRGVKIDAQNNVIIADGYNNRIRKLTLSNDNVTTIAGSGAEGLVNGAALQASFVYPNNAISDNAGSIYVGDGSSLLRQIKNDSVYTKLNGQNTSPSFLEIVDLAFDKNNNLIVVDGGSKVYKITPAGVVSIVAGTGTFGYTDGAGSSAEFNVTEGVAVDGDGNIIVADENNFGIRKIAPDGTVSTIAGTGTAGYTDGPASTAQFQDPVSVAVDKKGNIYVAEALYNRIRVISKE